MWVTFYWFNRENYAENNGLVNYLLAINLDLSIYKNSYRNEQFLN